MTLWILLICSLAINVVAFFYVRWLIRNLVYVTDGLDGLWESLEGFTEHIKQVNELEMFYGDETLASLIRHGSEIVTLLEEYRAAFEVEGDGELPIEKETQE